MHIPANDMDLALCHQSYCHIHYINGCSVSTYHGIHCVKLCAGIDPSREKRVYNRREDPDAW